MRLPTEAEMTKYLNINTLMWVIYVLLLAVLLPHTAWAFDRLQQHSEGASGVSWMAWALAVVFEAAVFGFTARLKDRIERSHRLKQKEAESRWAFGWRRFSSAYVNIYGLGLLLASGVSMLANFSYSVEFAQSFVAITKYALSPLLYELGFGGILPVASFLFARVLADTVDIEGGGDDTVEALKRSERAMKRELEAMKARYAEFEHLFAESKQDRIMAAHKLWPDLSGAGIASITGTAPSYVSTVLNSTNGHAS